MTSTSHLVALENRLSNERAYHADERTEAGKLLRGVWIAQIEKEIERERVLLGMPAIEVLSDMIDDELLAELGVDF